MPTHNKGMKIVEEVEPVSVTVKTYAKALGLPEGNVRRKIANDLIPSDLNSGRRLIPYAHYAREKAHFDGLDAAHQAKVGASK